MSTTAPDRPETAALAINGGAPVTDKPVPMIAVSLTDGDINAALEVLKSGMLAAGKNAMAFEEAFASASDANFGLTCANGANWKSRVARRPATGKEP